MPDCDLEKVFPEPNYDFMPLAPLLEGIVSKKWTQIITKIDMHSIKYQLFNLPTSFGL